MNAVSGVSVAVGKRGHARTIEASAIEAGESGGRVVSVAGGVVGG